MKAYDMSRYQRVIASEGRITGKWCVLGGVGRDPDRLIITPIEVTVYDEARSGGRCYYSGDFTVVVAGAMVAFSGHRNESKMFDIDAAFSEFEMTLRLVAGAYRNSASASPDSGREADQ